MFLADDHPLLREGLRRLLEADGHFLVVGEASTAEGALEQLETLTVDVVVMDIQLPGLDGVEATRRLKLRHPGLRVIILSAFGQEYLLPSIEAGADGYLLKTSGLMEVVRSLVQAAQGQSPVDPGLTRHLMVHLANGLPARCTLTPRQGELLRMVAEGMPSKELSSRLCVSPTTVKREFRNIFDALGVNDRAHAVAEAYRRRLV